MTRVVVLLLAFGLVVGLCDLATAQATAAPPADKQSRDAEPSKYADGTVKSVSADRVVVTGKEQGREAERMFAIDAGTTLKKGGQSIAATELKPGDSVQIRYLEANGKARADVITVQAPAKGKPKNPCAAVK